MRITHEADYAIRIVHILSRLETGERMGASAIAEHTGVTIRFTLKILRKLLIAGITLSYKGANGGYALKRERGEISIGEIIEIIDGPIQIAHCLDEAFSCTRVSSKDICEFYKIFNQINNQFSAVLYSTTFDEFISG